MNEQMTCCAHLRVKYDPEHTVYLGPHIESKPDDVAKPIRRGDPMVRPRWLCELCRAEFAPVPKSTRSDRLQMTMDVVREAMSSMTAEEFRRETQADFDNSPPEKNLIELAAERLALLIPGATIALMEPENWSDDEVHNWTVLIEQEDRHETHLIPDGVNQEAERFKSAPSFFQELAENLARGIAKNFLGPVS